MNCNNKAEAKDIEYLGDQKYQCPNCKPQKAKTYLNYNCSFNACKNKAWGKGDNDLCKKHFLQGINN